MKNNETGEFELVMGNRQLLSGFFIVCLLFGVAFAMGYIVGRNSSPSARAVSEMPTPAQAPVVSDTRPPAGSALPPAPPAVETTKPQPHETVSPAPAETKPPAETRGPTGEVPPPTPGIREPATGNYWQVMAVKQPEAEVVMRTLKEK